MGVSDPQGKGRFGGPTQRRKKIVVSGNPTDASFCPDPKNFIDYIGAEIFWVQFPSRTGLQDHLSTKITNMSSKMKIEGNKEKSV